jgi:hypothetical protein
MQLEKKENPMMELVAKLLKDSIPKPIQEMPMEQGVFRDTFYNWKLDRVEKASKQIAKIAENQNKTFQSNLNTIVTMANLQNDQTEREQNYRNRETLRVEAEKQARLLTQNQFYSAEQERIAAEIAKRNFQDMFKEEKDD